MGAPPLCRKLAGQRQLGKRESAKAGLRLLPDGGTSWFASAMWRVLPVVILLAACQPAPPMADACGAADRPALVGQSIQLALNLPPGARIIRPGDAVTEDFSETRLNVYLDSQDVITALACG